jgi:hypothetical protein
MRDACALALSLAAGSETSATVLSKSERYLSATSDRRARAMSRLKIAVLS